MHNQNVNLVRRAVREVTTLDFEARSQSLVATTDATASRQLWELERALGELPEDQRQVVLLVGLEGTRLRSRRDRQCAAWNHPIAPVAGTCRAARVDEY